jgi:hypothetical protein
MALEKQESSLAWCARRASFDIILKGYVLFLDFLWSNSQGGSSPASSVASKVQLVHQQTNVAAYLLHRT